MRITRVSVNFTETCNLGDYSNTKPSIELMADVEPGDDVQAVIATLSDLAKATLHAKIDEELELVGRSPKYYDGPLFSVYQSNRHNYILIAPAAARRHLSCEYAIVSRVKRDTALAKAQEALVKERERLFDGISDEFTAFVEQSEADWKRAEEARRLKDEEERRKFRERIEQEQEEEEDDEGFDDEEEDEEGKAGDQGE